MTMDISLCMIIKDEEEWLKDCLESVQGIVSEIIVVDTGSKDRSIDIARHYGACVVRTEWGDNFSEVRNLGLQAAHCSWILVMDADERLEPKRILLESMMQDPEVLGYYVKLINYTGDGEEYYTDAVCRFFRNAPSIRFKGRIHEEAASAVQKGGSNFIRFSQLTIHHFGYLNRVIRRKRKKSRNLRLIQASLKNNVDEAEGVDHDHCVLLYALGAEYFQNAKYRKALQVMLPLLPKLPLQGGYTSDVLLKTVFSLKEAGRPDEAEALMRQGLLVYPDFTDLLELMAITLQEREEYEQSLEFLHRSLGLGDVSERYSVSSGAGGYRSAYLAGTASEHLFDWDSAERYHQQALQEKSDYWPAWQHLCLLKFFRRRERELLNLFSRAELRFPLKAASLVLLLAVYFQKYEFFQELKEFLYRKTSLPPLQEALYHFHTSNPEQAINRLKEQYHANPADQTACLYLWAAANKYGNRRCEESYFADVCGNYNVTLPLWRLHSITEGGHRQSSIDDELYEDRSFSGSLILDEKTQTMLQACRNALMAIGAWSSLERLIVFVPQLAEWNGWTPDEVCLLLHAPTEVKQVWLSRLVKDKYAQTVYGPLLIGILAAAAGRDELAARYLSAYPDFQLDTELPCAALLTVVNI